MNIIESSEGKIRKLITLLQRGEKGESENSERALKRIAKSCKMTLEQLLEKYSEDFEEKRTYCLKLNCREERRIFRQLAIKLTGDCFLSTKKGESRFSFYECTEKVHIEVMTHWSVYKVDFAKYKEIMARAFIHKNDIYTGRELNEDEDRKLTEEEKRKLAKVSFVSQFLRRSSVHNQLPE